MKPRLPRLVVAWACALALAACSKTPPISFATELTPPAAESTKFKSITKAYETMTRAWTRHGLLTANYQQIIEVYATLRSPQWMEASLRREFAYAKPDAETRMKRVTESQASGTEFVDFTLMVSTWDRSENNLHHPARSAWSIALVSDHGDVITPISIERDKRPDYVIRAEFAAHGDFSTVYKVRFANKGVLAADRQSLKLRVYGVRGAVEMTWHNGERVSKFY